MTPAHIESLSAHCNRWFKSNELAVRACLDLFEVVHLWDDLVDTDKPFSDPDRAMRKMMLDLPSNPFWQSHLHVLQPVLQSAYLQWKASNVLEKTGDADDRAKAYMLRASFYQIVHFIALLCGGIEWAAEIGPEVYRVYGEKFEDYRSEVISHA